MPRPQSKNAGTVPTKTCPSPCARACTTNVSLELLVVHVEQLLAKVDEKVLDAGLEVGRALLRGLDNEPKTLHAELIGSARETM